MRNTEKVCTNSEKQNRCRDKTEADYAKNKDVQKPNPSTEERASAVSDQP